MRILAWRVYRYSYRQEDDLSCDKLRRIEPTKPLILEGRAGELRGLETLRGQQMVPGAGIEPARHLI
jgi:hypothetical protein